MQRTGASEAAFWARAMGQNERADGDFRRARELVLRTGAIDSTLELAGGYAEKAKAALAPFPADEWRTALEALADFAVSRVA